MGRALRTKETLPDFLKWRRVTRHPLVFRGLTGSQRTLGFWGVTVLLMDFYIGLLGQIIYRLCTKGRVPRTKETVPNFRERCRVTRHSRAFQRLTGSQRTPGIWGVTAWYQSLGIRIPRELGLGIHHHFGGLM